MEVVESNAIELLNLQIRSVKLLGLENGMKCPLTVTDDHPSRGPLVY